MANLALLDSNRVQEVEDSDKDLIDFKDAKVNQALTTSQSKQLTNQDLIRLSNVVSKLRKLTPQ